jgi:hypothetical protein
MELECLATRPEMLRRSANSFPPDGPRPSDQLDLTLRNLIEYLDELYRKAVRGYTLYHEFEELPVGPERTKLVTEHFEVIGSLLEQPAELRRRFIPYLQLTDS